MLSLILEVIEKIPIKMGVTQKGEFRPNPFFRPVLMLYLAATTPATVLSHFQSSTDVRLSENYRAIYRLKCHLNGSPEVGQLRLLLLEVCKHDRPAPGLGNMYHATAMFILMLLLYFFYSFPSLTVLCLYCEDLFGCCEGHPQQRQQNKLAVGNCVNCYSQAEEFP